jgi:hypothetical protein
VVVVTQISDEKMPGCLRPGAEKSAAACLSQTLKPWGAPVGEGLCQNSHAGPGRRVLEPTKSGSSAAPCLEDTPYLGTLELCKYTQLFWYRTLLLECCHLLSTAAKYIRFSCSTRAVQPHDCEIQADWLCLCLIILRLPQRLLCAAGPKYPQRTYSRNAPGT